MKALFDTNILIDYLNGNIKAKSEINLFKQRAISRITWIELLVGAGTSEEDNIVRDFLNKKFEVIEITPELSELAVQIRKSTKVKLPDAIIWASAERHQCLLVTRNTKDFPSKAPGIRVPY